MTTASKQMPQKKLLSPWKITRTILKINPKQEISKINKQILDNNKKMPSVTKINQWKNTSSVLQWLQKLPNKRKCTFISFNVVEFYFPISETLLEHARDFGTNYMNISDDYHYIIVEAKKSLLFNNRNH